MKYFFMRKIRVTESKAACRIEEIYEYASSIQENYKKIYKGEKNKEIVDTAIDEIIDVTKNIQTAIVQLASSILTDNENAPIKEYKERNFIK